MLARTTWLKHIEDPKNVEMSQTGDTESEGNSVNEYNS